MSSPSSHAVLPHLPSIKQQARGKSRCLTLLCLDSTHPVVFTLALFNCLSGLLCMYKELLMRHHSMAMVNSKSRTATTGQDKHLHSPMLTLFACQLCSSLTNRLDVVNHCTTCNGLLMTLTVVSQLQWQLYACCVVTL